MRFTDALEFWTIEKKVHACVLVLFSLQFGHDGSSTSRNLERNGPWPVRTYIVWLMIALWRILVMSPPLGRVVFWSHFGHYSVRYAENVSSKEQFTI